MAKRIPNFEIGTNLRIKQPVSIRDQVRASIRNDIYEGRILPGVRFSEAHLAKQINTSRTPVREALHMLEMEGLLESIPRVGYEVKSVKWEELEQLCEIRFVNEALAARWAMKRIGSKELHQLEYIIKKAENEIDNQDITKFWSLDAQFHESIAAWCGSDRLMELCNMLRHHMLRFQMLTVHVQAPLFKDIAKRVVNGHGEILAALKANDEDRLNNVMRDHLEQAKIELLQYVFGSSYLERKGTQK